jgi:hypothetical protein
VASASGNPITISCCSLERFPFALAHRTAPCLRARFIASVIPPARIAL